MKTAKQLTTLLVMGLTISSSQAVENNSAKAIAEASFDWSSFSITTAPVSGSSGSRPTIEWIYQDAYVMSNSQKNKAGDWNTSIEIAENGISSWSRANAAALHSYAKDVNLSPDSKAWSSTYRVGGFKVKGNGTITFSANYSLSSNLTTGNGLPNYADVSVLLTVSNLDNVPVATQKQAIDSNNSNTTTSIVNKADKLTLTVPVQDGQEFKFSADVHAKAALSDVVNNTPTATEAVVVGNWCASATEDCDGLFRINLSTGKRTLISAYTKADDDRLYDDAGSQTALNRGGKWWEKVAIGTGGDLYVYSDSRYDIRTDSSSKGVYHVSAKDGTRQLLSDLSAIKNQLPANSVPNHMLVSPSKQILLANSGKLISINSTTGTASILSDSANAAQGPGFSTLLGYDPNMDLFGLSGAGLIEIDPNNGNRNLFANYGIDPASTVSVIDAMGNILSADQQTLRKFNNTGSITVVSNLTNQAQGPVIHQLKTLTEFTAGNLIMLDAGNAQSAGKLVSVDSTSGTRSIISDFQDTAQGPAIYDARSVAIGAVPAFSGGQIDTGRSASGTQPSLKQIDSVDPAPLRQAYNYTVSFSNYAPDLATNVKLSDKLPKKSKLVSVVPSQGKCKGKTSVSCNFGAVAAGARVTARITVIPAKAGQVANKATVTYTMKKTGAKQKKNYRLVSTEATVVR